MTRTFVATFFLSKGWAQIQLNYHFVKTVTLNLTSIAAMPLHTNK